MVKSNVVTIGEGFWGNQQKIIRIYEKMTNTKTEGKFGCISVLSMDSCLMTNKNEEQIKKHYEYFESAILKNEDLHIFCFESKEDFERFDINGVLREKALIIDKINEEDYPMDIWELWTYVNRAYKVRKEGSHKVVLVDTTSGKEYLMGIHEPRRTLIKETDTTVEFGIYPVQTKAVKEVKKIKISKLVQSKLNLINKNPNWLAEEMGVATSSLYGKLERDSFNAYDLIKIAKIFNITFEELTEMAEM
jgi:hypothetical protein